MKFGDVLFLTKNKIENEIPTSISFYYEGDSLTQNRISFNIFNKEIFEKYLSQLKKTDFKIISSKTEENITLDISKKQNLEIKKQILRIDILWNDFYININAFKENMNKKDSLNELLLQNIIKTVYDTNITLLNEINILVSMYESYTQEKSNYLQYIQYFFGVLLLLLVAYSFLQLKAMESNAKKFLEYSKKVIEYPNDTQLEPIEISAEKEIEEATDTINCFIDKINSAMNYSASAMEQSKNASIKLEEITDEFDIIINELKGSAEISKHLDKSEEIVIQTQEELIKSTKKLQELKKELDLLLSSCRIK